MWLHYDVSLKAPIPGLAFLADEAERGIGETLGDGECSLSNPRL